MYGPSDSSRPAGHGSFSPGTAASCEAADERDDEGPGPHGADAASPRPRPTAPVDNDLALCLLNGCGQGDQRAFVQLCKLLEGALYRHLLCWMKHPEHRSVASGSAHKNMFAWLDESQRLHLIDQAVNAALFKVWQSAREFRGEARVLTWVQRIAQLKLFEAYRQLYPLIARQSQSIHVEPAEDEARSDPLRDVPADEGRSAEDVVSRWKDLEAVQHCLGKLNPQQRRSIELVYVECKTQKEAAEDQGVTRDTLAQRLRWAIKNLTACVKRPQVAKPLGGVL